MSEFLYMLKLANHGTIADIESEVDAAGCDRFLYLFLAFGASIKLFAKLQRMVIVDGIYCGVLLTASGHDDNFQVFSLAFCLVDIENEESWTYFFHKLEKRIANSPTLTFISDMYQSICKYKGMIFPRAHHGACLEHVKRNVKARSKSTGLAQMVKEAGTAYRIGGYREIYNRIRSHNLACAMYLGNIGVGHWTRAYLRGERYNLMTSNIAETLNKALLDGRNQPIVKLVTCMRSMLTRWFSARRPKPVAHMDEVSIEVDKLMNKHMQEVLGSKIASVANWNFDMVGKFGGEAFHVLLDNKRCTCKIFDRLKIPCGHALL